MILCKLFNKKYSAFGSVLLYILFSIPIPLFANGTLPMGTFEFPPFNYTHDKQVVGAGTAVVKKILSKLGYTPEITSYPWKRTLEMADEGEIAGLFTFTNNARRSGSNYITEPIATIYDVFYKRRDVDITWSNIQDLQEHIIGATDGYNYAPIFLEPMKSGKLKIDLIAAKTPELLHLRKIAAGRIDLAICEINLCNHIIKKMTPELDGLDYVDKKIGPIRNFHAGFSKKWPDSKKLVQKFNAEIKKMKNNGELKEILRQYGVITPVP